MTDWHLKQVALSADEILVVVEIVAESLALLGETSLVDETTRIGGGLGDSGTVLHVSLFLHLTNCSGGRILLTVVERVILLGDLETEDGVADCGANGHNSDDGRNDLRSLQLEMHSTTRVWQLKVEVLIDVTRRMGVIVGEIVCVHVVVMDEASTVLALRLEVEADIVPVSGPDLVVGVLGVTEVLGEGQGQRPSIKQGHLSLEVLVFACVVLWCTTYSR